MPLICLFDLSDILFYFFLFDFASYIFKSSVLTVLIAWCSFSSINWNQIRAQSHMWKSKSNSYHKRSFWATWPLLNLFIYIRFRIIGTTLYSYLWYSFFLLLYITQLLFLHSWQIINILRQMKKFLVDLITQLHSDVIHQLVGYCWVTTTKFFLLMNQNHFSFWWIHLPFSRVVLL